MKNAFKTSFTAGYEKIVIMGTDCYELDSQMILNAFNQLENAEIVIGPATDGGYYLLGMKKLHEEIFENIDWSTAKVLNQTISFCNIKSFPFSLLPELSRH